ncbi:MAG: aminotransferase class I/II-fold pyridoxal phosphate-dependent enzyme [Bacteroidales bacterium]|jgi:glycine C-acetyltransferase|nr:aminotransferase class I/II-fold pyridoxal phosphate-dependent enzyme [Bacteroidales bacterium]
MDLFDKTKNLGELGEYATDVFGYIAYPELEGEIEPYMKFKGKEMLVWSINNYLGLANHPEVKAADCESSAKWGLAYPMGSRIMSGQTKYHQQLEDELADFVGKEAAFAVNLGFQAMISLIDSLVGRNDVIIYDSDCHACIIDGMRIHSGKRFVYKHNDMESLEKRLITATKLCEKQNGAILVISEGIFGMVGNIGKIDKIAALKKRYNFRLLVDDAHGFGTLGKNGGGVGEHLGVTDDIDIYFSTFAKSMASIGAFIAAKRDIIYYLKLNMRSQIFSKSMPMPIVIGALKRLEIIKREPELRKKLWRNINKLKSELKNEGLNIGDSDATVTPVYLKCDVYQAMKLIIDLRENYKIFCSMVKYPVVPKGIILIRLVANTSHTDADIMYTVKSIKEVSDKLKNGVYDKVEISNMTLS